MTLVEPGEAVAHTEIWTLADGFSLSADGDEAVVAIEGLLA